MAVISISLPEALLDRADAFIDARGYAGRSELFRTALRDFLNREADPDPASDGRRSATVTLQYPHGVERKVSQVRHEHGEVVQSMMHGHSKQACVEVFMVQGEAPRIRAFVDGMRAIREVQLVEATYTDVPRLHAGP